MSYRDKLDRLNLTGNPEYSRDGKDERLDPQFNKVSLIPGLIDVEQAEAELKAGKQWTGLGGKKVRYIADRNTFVFLTSNFDLVLEGTAYDCLKEAGAIKQVTDCCNVGLENVDATDMRCLICGRSEVDVLEVIKD